MFLNRISLEKAEEKEIMKLFELMRIRQWYKNLVIFLPMIFAKAIGIIGIEKTLFGLLSLCLISSANYIINDVIDINQDRKNPEKRIRPIASGAVKIPQALVMAIAFIMLSLIIASFLSKNFLICMSLIFILTLIYSLWLKREAFADVIVVSTNFVIRAVSGAFIINVRVSPWLILCPFFLALFLAIGKRESEFKLMKDKAYQHRTNLKMYTPALTKTFTGISAALLIISYALYSFLSIYPQLIFTLPIAIYIIFRYLYLIETGSEIARHPERIYKDVRIVIAGIILLAMIFLLVYLI